MPDHRCQTRGAKCYLGLLRRRLEHLDFEEHLSYVPIQIFFLSSRFFYKRLSELTEDGQLLYSPALKKTQPWNAAADWITVRSRPVWLLTRFGWSFLPKIPLTSNELSRNTYMCARASRSLHRLTYRVSSLAPDRHLLPDVSLFL